MQDFHPQSPEERRKRLAEARARFGTEVVGLFHPRHPLREIVKRVAMGVYEDGFIYAGNLAYVTILALFPFFIVSAAVARFVGRTTAGQQVVGTIMQQIPREVAAVLTGPVEQALSARTGPLLW